jgi:hypothetical protein
MTWMAWHPWLVNFSTHITIFWEISFCVLMWNRLARPLMLICAVFLHLGIGAFLGMWTFGLIMLLGNAAFLPTDLVRRLVGALAPIRLAPIIGKSPLWALSRPVVPGRAQRPAIGGMGTMAAGKS